MKNQTKKDIADNLLCERVEQNLKDSDFETDAFRVAQLVYLRRINEALEELILHIKELLPPPRPPGGR